MTESFFLKIDSSTPDGVRIKNSIDVKVQCSESTAVAVIVHLLNSDESLAKIIIDGVMMHLSGQNAIESVAPPETD